MLHICFTVVLMTDGRRGWPLSSIRFFASSKTAATRQESQTEFVPTTAEIQRVKDGLRITVEPYKAMRIDHLLIQKFLPIRL